VLVTTADDQSEVRAYDEGSGPPIIIVHPGLDDGRSYKRVAAKLSGDDRVLRLVRRQYRLDLPGGCSIGQEVSHVLALAAVAERPSLLFGHSSGAVVALEALIASPSSFVGAVLYEPPLVIGPPLGGDAGQRARAALSAGKRRQAMTIFLGEIVGFPASQAPLAAVFVASNPRYRNLIPRQFDDTDAMDSLGCRLDAYAGLDLPIVLVGGERSPAHQAERLDALQARLPNAERIVMTGRGHDAHVKAPGEVARIIKSTASRLLS
jgi:pimeloyl-ACP methyl ester carboxylesterase